MEAAPAVPRGFQIGLFRTGFVNPTAIAFGPDGRLYVAQQDGRIRAAGRTGIVTIAAGLGTPLGLAWHGRTLFVSWTTHMSTLTPDRRYQTFRRRTIVSGLPTGRHQNDGLAFRGGWVYVGVGSTCDACVEADPRSATIMRFHLDGSDPEIFARGLRNPYGLAIRPATGHLYATDNGRDDFGNSVPDELNLIKRGGNYGWPNCWGAGGGTDCAGTVAPVALFEPHSSADGIVFYQGRSYPAAYRSDAFVAEWGDSVNGLGTGQRVKRVHFRGTRAEVSDFVLGLIHPLAVTMDSSGSLLVADWATGNIWRVRAQRA